MSKRAYAGRHRGRHRAPVEQRPGRGVALPGAAAAALTITATGAVLVPGAAGAQAQEHATDTDTGATTAAAAPTATATHVADASAALRSAEIAEVAAAARAEARLKASRAAERKALAAKKAKALAEAHKWVLPVPKGSYRVSSGFGMRWGKLHAGNDFAAPVGTRVGSISSGTVVFAGQQSGYGNKVEIRHWDGTVSWYGHLSSIEVKVGQDVAAGDEIARSGNTGHSTGPHLHLEIHPGGKGPVNPRPWLAEHGVKF